MRMHALLRENDMTSLPHNLSIQQKSHSPGSERLSIIITPQCRKKRLGVDHGFLSAKKIQYGRTIHNSRKFWGD